MLDKHQFFIDGSTYRHTLLTAVSYWADGEMDAAAAELASGEAFGEWEFITHLRDHAKFLRSLRENTDTGIDSRCYDLILAMVDALNAGDAYQQVGITHDPEK